MNDKIENIVSSTGRKLPHPVEFWRDCLDAEIIRAVSLGAERGLRGSLELSVLAKDRLEELLLCGCSSLKHHVEKKL